MFIAMNPKKGAKHLRFFILACALLSCARAAAMDPFTAISVGSSAVDAIQSIAGASKEAAATAEALSALGELTNELDGESSQEDQDAAEITRRMKELQAAAEEAGYTVDEVNDILSGTQGSTQDLAAMARRLTRSIKLAKHLASLAGLSPLKASQVSEVEQVQSRNDEKKILTSIYHEMVMKDMESKHAELHQQKEINQELGRLNKSLGQMAPGGDLRFFPAQGAIVQKAITVFQSYSGYLLGLVVLIFVGRLIYYQFSFAPKEKYSELVFNSLTCFFLMATFPTLYGYMGSYSDGLASQMAKTLHVAGAVQPEPGHLFGHVMPWWLQPAVLQSIVYLLIYSIFNLVLAVLIAVGPIAILAGTMLHFTFSLPAYFAALVLVWLWPVVWNVVGYFASILWQGREWSGSGIAQTLTAVIFWVVQLLSPLLLFNHLKKTQAGQAIHGAVRGAISARPARAAQAKGQALAGKTALAAGQLALQVARKITQQVGKTTVGAALTPRPRQNGNAGLYKETKSPPKPKQSPMGDPEVAKRLGITQRLKKDND